MLKGRFTLRSAAVATAAAALITGGALLPATPAAARPADCTLRVEIYRLIDNLVGRALVSCPRVESHSVKVYIRRWDGFSGRVVASKNSGDKNTSSTVIAAFEPCSDVQTSKKYTAHGYLYDERFGYPIEVDDKETGKITGPC